MFTLRHAGTDHTLRSTRLRRGLFRLALVGALLAATAADGGLRAAPPSDRPRVIPDTEGAIAEIVLHYLPELDDDLEPLYRDLFSKLPEDVRIQVVCPSRGAVDRFREVWGADAVATSRKVELAAVDRSITLWSRDRRIARHGARSYRPASQFIPAPNDDYEPEKRNEILMASDLVRARLMGPYLAGLLYLEGGNVVSNGHHVFIGANAVSDNALLGFEEQRLVGEVAGLFGARPVILKDYEGGVPFCHVDMYMTPLDEKTVLVASVTEGLCALYDNEDSKEGIPDWALETLDTSTETAQKFDFIASQAEQLGYEVLRVPALIDESESWMITYNNVLIDRRAGRSAVYMPVYQIPALDAIAESIYCGLGFEPRTVDVSRIYELGGAARCIVNVTRRRPEHSPPVRLSRTLDEEDSCELASEPDNGEPWAGPQYGELAGAADDYSGRLTQ